MRDGMDKPERKSCSVCGETKPLSDFYRQAKAKDGRQAQCKACAKAKSLAKYRDDPEKFRDSSKRYYHKNRDEVLSKAREWRKDNLDFARERARGYAAKYRREKPWVFAERYEKEREANLARQAIYRAENPEVFRAKAAARRALLAGATIVPFTAEQLRLRMSMFGNKCWICGISVQCETSAIDHVKPLSRGGLHVLSNLRLSCRLCNTRKHNTWPFSPQDAWWVGRAESLEAK